MITMRPSPLGSSAVSAPVERSSMTPEQSMIEALGMSGARPAS